MARARTLSFALAAIGLIAFAASASAGEVFETRVELTRVVQTEAGNYRVKGRVHSPLRACEEDRRVKLIAGRGGDRVREGDRADRRGRFSLYWVDRTPREHYRVKVFRKFNQDGSLKCEADVKRFRTPS